MTLYKVLNVDGSPCHGGTGHWPLPTKRADGSWEPGAWLEVTGALGPCYNGLRLCNGLAQLLEWLGPAVYAAEYDGERLDANDKIVVRRARLLRRFETWDERTARLFACDCAERALPSFENDRPDDPRPREAIAVARRFARGEATGAKLTAAWAAASDAATAAARAAAWGAAWDAAWAAAWGAERRWQAERLAQYLRGEVAP